MRVEVIESQLQRLISQFIINELRDSKVGFVTITQVTTSKDLDLAKVYFNVLGNEEKIRATGETLNKAKGLIKSYCAKQITIRKMPDLRFEYDASLENGNKIEMILKNIKSK